MRWVRGTLNVVVRTTVPSIRPCGSVTALLLTPLLMKRPLQLVEVYLDFESYSAVSFVPTSLSVIATAVSSNILFKRTKDLPLEDMNPLDTLPEPIELHPNHLSPSPTSHPPNAFPYT